MELDTLMRFAGRGITRGEAGRFHVGCVECHTLFGVFSSWQGARNYLIRTGLRSCKVCERRMNDLLSRQDFLFQTQRR